MHVSVWDCLLDVFSVSVSRDWQSRGASSSSKPRPLCSKVKSFETGCKKDRITTKNCICHLDKQTCIHSSLLFQTEVMHIWIRVLFKVRAHTTSCTRLAQKVGRRAVVLLHLCIWQMFSSQATQSALEWTFSTCVTLKSNPQPLQAPYRNIYLSSSHMEPILKVSDDSWNNFRRLKRNWNMQCEVSATSLQ